MIKVEKVDAYRNPSGDVVVPVKKIEVYKTSDGTLFYRFKDAAKMQGRIDLDKVIDRHGADHCEKWDADMFSDWMLENAKELGEILTQASRSS